MLGGSGSFAGPTSPASGYLGQAEQDGRSVSLVLDLGNGALGALQRHLDPDAVSAIFITHLHPDHCLDLTGLYVYRKYHPNRPPVPALPVYAPAGAQERLAAAYEGMDERGMDEQLHFHPVHDGSRVRLGPFVVAPHPGQHPGGAVGQRVQAGGPGGQGAAAPSPPRRWLGAWSWWVRTATVTPRRGCGATPGPNGS